MNVFFHFRKIIIMQKRTDEHFFLFRKIMIMYVFATDLFFVPKIFILQGLAFRFTL